MAGVPDGCLAGMCGATVRGIKSAKPVKQAALMAASNIIQPAHRIEAHRATVGDGLAIRRALPTVQRRMIGAWCFLDHIGPAAMASGPGLRVGPHPHIGLQTVTWLLEGEILHRDSLGTVQNIRPGQLNLMTSGRGISHSEESPAARPPLLHGAQLWIALPDHQRYCEPGFAHHAGLPLIERGALRMTLLAGEFEGERSPAQIYTPLVGLDINATSALQAVLTLRPDFEYGALVLEGEVRLGEESLQPGTLLYLPPQRDQLALKTTAAARLLLLGGAPFAEGILMWWNFVGRSKDEIVQATRDWNAGRNFGEVQGYDGARLVAPMPPWAA
ncbi:MAG: pirin family protein [Stenotrophobium sp.]